jgi:hypothetical protein
MSNEGTDDACPYDSDAVGRTWSSVPDTIERGFHVGRQHGTLRRYLIRQDDD